MQEAVRRTGVNKTTSKKGGVQMTEDSEARCPCCHGALEYFPDQGDSCDYCCSHCGWREHVPASDEIGAALTLHGRDNTVLHPIVVVWVRGGLVQGVEADAPARAIVCDFDCQEEDASRVGERPCFVSEWDPPDEPDEEFGEVLQVLDGEKQRVPADQKAT
jgi:hypothetical protein